MNKTIIILVMIYIVSSTARCEEQVLIRRNIYDPNFSAQLVADYTKAVATMQQWSTASSDNPCGWTFQANMHGTFLQRSDWNQCQHGSYFFLSWHRMYLYWFERIARKASGNPAFALPYWNYSNPQQAALPPAFRVKTSPLFIAERGTGINTGSRLDPRATDFSQAWAMINFDGVMLGAGTPTGFGGAVAQQPEQFLSTTGQLEQIPHNMVHDQVGGLMGNPLTAAQDPIFWLHHANIDRLWTGWIQAGQGRANPSDNMWLNQVFTFYDENKQPQKMTGAEIVDTVKQLHYTYDDDPRSISGSTDPQLLKDDSHRSEVIGSTKQDAGILLGAEPTIVKIPLAPNRSNRMLSLLAEGSTKPRIVLTLRDITFERAPGASYEIYINRSAHEGGRQQNPNPVGTLSFFAIAGHGAGHTPAHSGPREARFDVTRQVLVLNASAEWRESEMEITLVPILPIPEGNESVSVDGNPKVGKIEFSVEFPPAGTER